MLAEESAGAAAALGVAVGLSVMAALGVAVGLLVVAALAEAAGKLLGASFADAARLDAPVLLSEASAEPTLVALGRPAADERVGLAAGEHPARASSSVANASKTHRRSCDMGIVLVLWRAGHARFKARLDTGACRRLGLVQAGREMRRNGTRP